MTRVGPTHTSAHSPLPFRAQATPIIRHLYCESGAPNVINSHSHTDDFDAWRRKIRLLIGEKPELQVISEASDGAEAVRKANDLKPELIVLDIGLSELDGIEAARQMQKLCPGSKILFLSLNADLDVMRAALGTGALGYVHKMNADGELLSAVDAVLRGEQFVSSSLRARTLAEVS